MADARTLIGLGSAVISVPLLASAAAAGAPAGLPGRLVERLSIAAPSGVSGPDDITRLAREGIDGGREVVYLAYQNGINPDGTAGTPGGPTSSTIKGFDAVTGRLVMSVPAPGKVDGLSADPARGRLLATVNEDSNSALLTVTPGVDKPVTRYTYRPDPAVGGNGGTDSIAVHAGHIYLAHSNPTDATQATDYEATLDPRAQTAALRPVFLDNTMATDASTGPRRHPGPHRPRHQPDHAAGQPPVRRATGHDRSGRRADRVRRPPRAHHAGAHPAEPHRLHPR